MMPCKHTLMDQHCANANFYIKIYHRKRAHYKTKLIDKCCSSFSALERKDYEVCGKIMAIGMVHGGPPPGFLAPCLYDCITMEPGTYIMDVCDLPLSVVRGSLETVNIHFELLTISIQESHNFL